MHDPAIFAPWPERKAFQERLDEIYNRRWATQDRPGRVIEISRQLRDMKKDGDTPADVDPKTVAAAEHYGFSIDLRTGRMTNLNGEDVTIT